MNYILRSNPETNYTKINNIALLPNQLSAAALGILVRLISRPANWQVNVKQLIKETEGTAKRTGRDAMYKILNELKRAGFVKEKSGTYWVSDAPIFANETPQQPVDNCKKAAKQLPENPETLPRNTENPDAVLPENPDKPLTENPDALIIKEDIKIKDQLINDLCVDNLKDPKPAVQKIQTALPADFQITDTMRAWYAEQPFGLDITYATEQWKKFILKAKRYRFADWDDAWKDGMGKINGFRKQQATQASPVAKAKKALAVKTTASASAQQAPQAQLVQPAPTGKDLIKKLKSDIKNIQATLQLAKSTGVSMFASATQTHLQSLEAQLAQAQAQAGAMA